MKKKEKQLMDIYFQNTPAYKVRKESFNGADYVVVPVVMMVEGVHSGSHGPILHTAEELGKIPETWNGIPVTIGHPQVDGQYVSATSPEILKDWAVGTIFNAYMDGDSLKAEAWIEESKIQTLSDETYQRINDGEIIEVSVGVFSDEELTEGTYEGENYIAIARNHRPNHLALLPDEVGACSVKDGCGIRVNRKGGIKMEIIVNETNEQQVLKELSAKGFTINETGYYERANKAQSAINNLDNGTSYHYIEEIFDDYLVYRANYSVEGLRSSKYFKQTYQENAAGEIELTGEAVQVKRVVDYPVVPSVNTQGTKRMRKFINNSKKEENTMSEKCAPCVKAAVDALINNKATAYAETDREWLEGLDESQLEKMNPIVVEKTVEVNTFKAPQTTAEYLETVPKEIREQVESGLRIHAERKAGMISAITANTESPWTKEELETMAMSMLEKVYLTANKREVEQPINYAGFGVVPKLENNSDPVEVLLPIGI